MLSLDYENHLFGQGYSFVAGIDEAGRGPLAGPVVAAAVILDKTFIDNAEATDALREIRDSKKISPKKRKRVAENIKTHCPYIGIGICDNETIDRMNILQASFLAMKKALSELRSKPEIILVDGKFRIPRCSYAQKTIPGGDEKIFSIAVASIMAKITRDEIMEELHLKYPNYDFDKHKGYGTKQHMDSLKRYGPCPLHRKSFKPIKK